MTEDGGAFCVRFGVFFLFFMKAILSLFDFRTIFFIFALTFHQCQIVMKAILSFFDSWTILLFFLFFF